MSGGLGVTRWTLAVCGVLVATYGVVRLLGLGVSNLLATIPWLAGGIVGHDAVLAPLVLLLGAASAQRLPGWARGPAVLVLVVLGSVTLAALPALGRFGAKADNPTLLDRPYAAGWAVVLALVLGVAGLQAFLRRRKGAERG